MALSVTDLGIDGLEDIEQIGTGGSSRVYRARQSDLDRVVAVKVLNAGEDQDVVRRFDRERKAMGRLSLHEGIVPVYSSGLTQHGEPYLVMPYYPSGSLQDQIDTGAMDWETAVHYVDVAAETIAAAHDEGIVHLDLKPANILLTVNGAPRIADFGIARLLTGTTAARTNGNAAFTPAYSAPETFLDGETGPASDVYGLGATLWALLVGHPPFLTPGNDANLMSVIGRVVNNPVGDLRHFTPAPICDVIERAMTKQPELRYQSAREFSQALKAAAAMAASGSMNDETAAFAAPAPPVASAPVVADQTVVESMAPGSVLFPDAADTYVDAGATNVLSTAPGPELPASLANTVPPADAPARPLLQETAQPLPAPVGGRQLPPPRPPLIDFERFRLGPILLGLMAFLTVGIAALLILGRDDAGDSGNTVISNPAAPSTDTSLDTSAPTAASTGSTGAVDSSTTATTATSPTSVGPTPTSAATTASTSSSSSSETTDTTASTTSETTDSTASSTTDTSTSSSSSSSSTTLPIQPPTALTATATADAVSLSWTAPGSGPTPTGYVVVRDGTPVGTVTTTSFTDTSVQSGERYQYEVRSVGEDATERSEPSAPESVTVPPPASTTTSTTAPAELTLSATPDPRRTQILVSITASQCVTYEVTATPAAGAPTRVVGPATGVCSETHQVRLTGLEAETAYDVTVVVTNETTGTTQRTTLSDVTTRA